MRKENLTVLGGVCLIVLAKNQIYLNEAKWDEIKENKTPRKITNMDRKTELKRMLYFVRKPYFI